ncbi:MAG: hypothetical protein GF350_17165 [Chitinivibrionales bacterium]|nr:hypothetical protein [Chitinivibrionales bacterium]
MNTNSITEIAHKKTSVIILFAALLYVAFFNRFTQDDAFISFRYARNLVEGHGLVWNPGEKPVEGYTNFLWTVMMAVPHVIGMDVVVFSRLLGLLFYVGTLVTTWLLSMMLFRSRVLSHLTILLLGTNYTFSCYATGGLETQLQAFLITSGAWLYLHMTMRNRCSHVNFAGLSIITGAAVLTRPDSVLPFAVITGLCIVALLRNKGTFSGKAPALISLLGPATCIITGYGLWKILYYGSLVPNTFHAKVSSVDSLKQGVRYVLLFFHSYWLVPFPFIVLFSGSRLFSKNRLLAIPATIIVIWCAYVISVGGDFMEFRFMVPVLPLLFVIITAAVMFIRQITLRTALIVMVLAGSFVHASTFHYTSGIESIRSLQSHLISDHENWIFVGKRLGELFSDCDEPVTVAATAIGALGYYSGLRIIDMHGLTDRHIARHGTIVSTRAGHAKLAPIEYLKQKNTTLIAGHPYCMETAETTGIDGIDSEMMSGLLKYPVDNKTNVILIPVDSSRAVPAIYLEGNSCVDDLK